jgi:hypothetical protein
MNDYFELIKLADLIKSIDPEEVKLYLNPVIL